MRNFGLTKLIGRRETTQRFKKFSTTMDRDMRSGRSYMVNDVALVFEKFSDDRREMIFRTYEYFEDGIGKRVVFEAPCRGEEHPDISIKDIDGKTIKIKYSDKDADPSDVCEYYVDEDIYNYIRHEEINVCYNNLLFRLDYVSGRKVVQLCPTLPGHFKTRSSITLSLADAYLMIMGGELKFIRAIVDENPFIHTAPKSPKIELDKCYIMHCFGGVRSMIFKGFIGATKLLFAVDDKTNNTLLPDSKNPTQYKIIDAVDIALGKVARIYSTVDSNQNPADKISLSLTVGCNSDSTYMVYDPDNGAVIDVPVFEEKRISQERTTCTILYEVLK